MIGSECESQVTPYYEHELIIIIIIIVRINIIFTGQPNAVITNLSVIKT